MSETIAEKKQAKLHVKNKQRQLDKKLSSLPTDSDSDH
jgi:hypothetical protein